VIMMNFLRIVKGIARAVRGMKKIKPDGERGMNCRDVWKQVQPS